MLLFVWWQMLLTAMGRLGVWIMDLELKPWTRASGKLKSGQRQDNERPVWKLEFPVVSECNRTLEKATAA